MVRLEVEDMGHGIPAETLRRISNTRCIAGVGLSGLQERLRLLGGRLELVSGSSGTTVRAIVPLVAQSLATPVER